MLSRRHGDADQPAHLPRVRRPRHRRARPDARRSSSCSAAASAPCCGAPAARRAVLARDNRLSSPSFRDALAAGLTAAGVDVVDLGLVPTPLLYYGLHHLPCDGGVMITGSHNPPEFNGFKIAIGKSTIWGPRIQELRGVIERRDFESGAGALSQADIVGPYREMVAREDPPRAPAAGRGRRRQRHRRDRRAAAAARAGLRGHRALVRARRHLPRPLPRPDRAGEPRGPHPHRARARARLRHRLRRRRRPHRRRRRAGRASSGATSCS